MSEKKYPFPKKTGTLQKHNFNNKLDIFLTLVLVKKGYTNIMIRSQMMSEKQKRFEVIFYGDAINCVRDENGKEYNLHETINILMDQQATINRQENEMYFKNKLILDIMTKLKDRISMEDDYYSKELMEMILKRLEILEMELEE